MQNNTQYIQVIELVNLTAHETLQDDFLRRVCTARDGFLRYIRNVCVSAGSGKRELTLTDHVESWFASMYSESRSFVDPEPDLGWTLGFGPIAPFVFIAIADQVFRDPTLLDYVETDIEGNELKRVTRPRYDGLLPDDSGNGRRGDVEQFLAIMPLDHILIPVPRVDTPDE